MVGSALKKAFGLETEIKNVQKALDSDLRRFRKKRKAFKRQIKRKTRR